MSEASEARDLDEQIAEVQRSIDEIDASLRDDAGTMDSEERAATLTNREEQSGILDGLKRRRESLG